MSTVSLFLTFVLRTISTIASPLYLFIAILFIGVGLLPILKLLTDTKHAVNGALAPQKSPHIATCKDSRFSKRADQLGGSNAFTFGLLWLILGGIASPGSLWQALMLGAALEGIGLSFYSIATLVQSIKDAPRIEGRRAWYLFLCPHFIGCGYDIAIAGPFFVLFWLQKLIEKYRPDNTIAGLVWFGIMGLRDFLMLINWILSIPFVLLLNLVTIPATKTLVLPGLPRVPDMKSEEEHPHID